MTELDSYDALLAQQKRNQDAYSSAANKVSRGKYQRSRTGGGGGGGVYVEEDVPFRISVETVSLPGGNAGHHKADNGSSTSFPKSPNTPNKDFYHVVDETLGEVDEDLGPEEKG